MRTAEKPAARPAKTSHTAKPPHFTFSSPLRRETPRLRAAPSGARAPAPPRSGPHRVGAATINTLRFPGMTALAMRGTGCALALDTTVQRALRQGTTKSSAMRVIEG